MRYVKVNKWFKKGPIEVQYLDQDGVWQYIYLKNKNEIKNLRKASIKAAVVYETYKWRKMK